jgi:hypothetical protein
VITALVLLACPAPKDDKAEQKPPEKKAAAATDEQPTPELVAEPAVTAPAGCTVDHTSQTVDGSSLWTDIPSATNPANCNFHRFAYNNFLYMVGGPTPRFMTELASTHELAKTGTWPTAATPTLTTRDILNVPSDEFETGQAGDDFSLVDVDGQTVLYDIRINQTMWSSISANGWNTKAGLTAAQTAFTSNSQTGGVWLPPNDTGDPSIEGQTGDDSIEVKTSWRNYGKNPADCPSAIMFCMTDSNGDTLGLLGMHFVQKTPTRGEWVWASFEHVANSPDCSPTVTTTTVTQGSSNPLQQDPRDPTNPSATINVNTGDLAAQTGWTAFNFGSYTTGGGDGTRCEFSQGTPAHPNPGVNTNCTPTSGTPQCNGNPNPSGDGSTFVQTNICRTDPIPDHSTPTAIAAVCASATNNGNNVACITQSVLDNWPSGLDDRWKYYMLVGTEWLDATSVQTVGCFGITNTATDLDNFACPQPSPQTFATTGTVHLANTTMETWMQAGACLAYVDDGTPTTVGATDCFGCHQPTTSTTHGDLSHTFGSFGSN